MVWQREEAEEERRLIIVLLPDLIDRRPRGCAVATGEVKKNLHLNPITSGQTAQVELVSGNKPLVCTSVSDMNRQERTAAGSPLIVEYLECIREPPPCIARLPRWQKEAMGRLT